MKWRRVPGNDQVIASDTVPEYRVSRYGPADQPVYRASYRGEFIGFTSVSSADARQVCENHRLITQEAKELSDEKTTA